MRKVFFSLLTVLSVGTLSGAPLCLGDPQPKSPCAGWESMQQLRSLIPERIWEQEFDIVVDCEAFEKALPEWSRSEKRTHMDRSRYSFAHSSRFYLRSVLSGEYVRINDRYEEFQFSPFWKNPPRVAELRALEKQVGKGSREE